MAEKIPLSEPWFEGNEWQYVKDCLDRRWVSSAGAYVAEFEQTVAKYTGATFAVAVQSGTAALHLALLISDVQAGDLVLLPNVSFVASANAVTYAGASPVLFDVHQDHWQMDEDLVASFLHTECQLVDGNCLHTPSGRRVKAIMPVHALGLLAPSFALQRLAEEYQLIMIEDAAEALGSWLKDKHAGTIGSLGCLSFNGNKILTTGGGGMILTHSSELAAKAKHLSTQAKSHPRLYLHDELGYNYRLSNIQAALGVAQMEQLQDILSLKEKIELRYREELVQAEWPLSFARIHPESHPNYWLPSFCSSTVDQIRMALTEANIQTRPLWSPLNRLPMYNHCRYITTEDHSGRIVDHSLSLPAFPALTDAQQSRIIKIIQQQLTR
ncbi:MAG: LegC family aminotransferase [Bacteroidota bacterium]